jgi:putative NADPH-quinone reductase
LLAAETLVLVYPVWNEGFPAILKGFFARAFIPGVSFQIGPDGASTPNLGNLTKMAAACTYGGIRRFLSDAASQRTPRGDAATLSADCARDGRV